MSGNDNKEGEKDDAYDLDYYERTDRKDDENLRREVGSVKKQLNNAIKVSMLANLCLLLLGIATLALLSFVVFNNLMQNHLKNPFGSKYSVTTQRGDFLQPGGCSQQEPRQPRGGPLLHPRLYWQIQKRGWELSLEALLSRSYWSKWKSLQ